MNAWLSRAPLGRAFGATWIHADTYAAAGALTPGFLARIVLAHALLPAVMIGLALWRTRLARHPAARGQRPASGT